MHEAFERVFGVAWDHDVCIAGGAVVDLELASDIDVFYWNVSGGTFIAPYLDPFRGYRTSDTAYAEEEVLFTGQGHVEGVAKPINIICSTKPTLEAVIDNFDISTHATAVRPDGTVYLAPHFTAKQEQPRVIHFRRPVHTMKRLLKICRRYGTSMHPDDVEQLFEKAMELEDWGEGPGTIWTRTEAQLPNP
jgi:hypothetical protein